MSITPTDPAFPTVTVTVRTAGDVAKILDLAAQMWRDSDPTQETDAARYSPEAVRRAYEEGKGDNFRAMLHAMAKKSLITDDVYWREICAAIGLSPKRASGVLGSAMKRLDSRPPFTRIQKGDDYWFQMPHEVAKLIIQLAKRDAAGGS